MTSPTQIRIDSNVKVEATKLFKKLGLDMSSAVNLFLNQCILREGLPFAVELHSYKEETIKAMEEAKAISKDSAVKGYKSLDALNAALDED